MSAEPRSHAATPRRTRLAWLLAALLLLLVAAGIASRQFATGRGAVQTETQTSPAASEDCEEEPPPTSFTLAECDADDAGRAPQPGPPAAEP